MQKNDDGSQRVYVFRDDTEAGEVLIHTNWEALPKITRAELPNYLIHSPRSRDFLEFDCNIAEASNDEPALLQPYDNEE